MENLPQYDVVVADRARQMLGAHLRFLADVSPVAAREMQSKMLRAIRSLGTMPSRFPFLNAEQIPPNKYHKMHVERRYLVLYQIKDRMVYVDYIVDCRQDYGWLIQ